MHRNEYRSIYFSNTGIKAAISLGLIRDFVICKENRVWS